MLYKWEKNSGLDHKCGICKTVLSSPRAKKTCFGVHEEVCPRYHFTLFYIGNSSKCDACRKSVELHDKRHREIAGLILRVRSIDEAEQEVLNPANNRKRKTRKSDVFEDFENLSTLDNVGEEGDWADASTLNDGDLEANALGPVQLKEQRRPKRLKKTDKKKAKLSKPVQVIMPELMESIDAVLHPENHLPDDKEHRPGGESNAALSNTVIGDNIAFNANCSKPSTLRQSVHNKKLLKANGIGKRPSPQNAQDDPGITLILEQFGISSTLGQTTKERNTLFKQLRNAIRDDAEKVENESRDTMMRMAGYWRYVNRKTYNSMVRNNEIWDWVTGQRLEEIEEEEEIEAADTEDDRDSDLASWDDSSTLVAPSNGAATSAKEVEDYAEDFELGRGRRLHLVEGHCGLWNARSDEQTQRQSDIEHGDSDGMPTPKASRFPINASERRVSVPETKLRIASSLPRSQAWPSTMKDDRHLRSKSICKLKKDEPLKIVPANSASPTADTGPFSAPHDDPNNRYNPLTSFHEDIAQRITRASKPHKVAPPGVLSARDMNSNAIRVTAKGPGPGKTSYAGAVKKKV